MLAVLSNQHKFDVWFLFWNKIFGYQILFLFSWITNILWNPNFHIFTQKAVAMTLKLALLLAIGSQNWIAAVRKWAIIPRKIFQPWRCSALGEMYIWEKEVGRRRRRVRGPSHPPPSHQLRWRWKKWWRWRGETLYILPRDSWGGGGGVEEGLLLPTFALIPR